MLIHWLKKLVRSGSFQRSEVSPNKTLNSLKNKFCHRPVYPVVILVLGFAVAMLKYGIH